MEIARVDSHRAVCSNSCDISRTLGATISARKWNEAHLAADSHSFVGIFWAVKEEGSAAVLLDHRCPVSDAEPYGDMLTCSHGHYEVWEQWRKDATNARFGPASLIASDEYEDWPRGRIVYASPDGPFVLYADTQILSRPDLLTCIHERFGLQADRIETK